MRCDMSSAPETSNGSPRISVAPAALMATSGPAAAVNSIAVGLLVVVLSLPRGQRSDTHYGGWDRFVV